MKAHIKAVTYPKLFFVGRKANAVAWVAMPAYRPCTPSFNLYAGKLPACFYIPHFKAQEAVNSYINACFCAIDCKRPDEVGERTYFAGDGMCFCISHLHPGRCKIPQVNMRAGWAIHRVMRPVKAGNLFNYIPGFAVHHVPDAILKSREVHDPAIRRHGHAVGAAFYDFFPDNFAGGKIYALKGFDGTYVNAVKRNADSNPFNV